MTGDQQQNTEQLSAGELQRRAIGGSSWTAIHTAVSLPIAFVANAIVARSLGVSSYGDLAFLTAALGLAYGFANFGFSTALIQRGSGTEARGLRHESDELLKRSLGFHVVVELPILLVVALALTRGDPAWEMVAVGSAMILSCVLSGAALCVTIENRTAAAARLAIAINLALQGATVTVALLTSSASAVWAVRTVVPAAALVLTLQLLDRERRRTVLRPRLPGGLGSGFWRFALSSWAAGLVGLLVFSRSEIFLLQWFDQTEALGLFALAFGLGYQITAPVDAMLHALTPAVAGILAAWPERAAQTFERSIRVSALLAGGVAAAVIPPLVFAIPFIYGKSFESAAWLFLPLALVSVFQSVNNPVLAFVNGRQRGGLLLKVNSVALIVNVGVALALIPAFGAWGAVTANVIGQLLVLIWLAATEPLATARGFKGLMRFYRLFFVGTAIAGVALGAGAILESASPILAVSVAGLVGTGLYVVAVRLSRDGLTTEDHDALVSAMAVRARPLLSRMLRPVTVPRRSSL